MAKIYFSDVVGAYYGSNTPKAPDFLDVKVLSSLSYATTPGFGPGYVNTSRIIVKHYSAKITRELTAEEDVQLKIWLQRYTKFADREAMLVDLKKVKADARYYTKHEQETWKRQAQDFSLSA